MGTLGREGRDGKVGEQNPGQETGELTWPCHLGCEGLLAELWAEQRPQENQRAHWQVGSRQQDSVMSCFPKMTQRLAPGL